MFSNTVVARRPDSEMASWIYRILMGIDAIASLVAGYFFLVGLSDGSVSAFNIRLWIGILFAVAAIVAGGVALRRANRPVLANIVLAILAAPAALYGIFIFAVIFSGTNWN